MLRISYKGDEKLKFLRAVQCAECDIWNLCPVHNLNKKFNGWNSKNNFSNTIP